MQYFSESEGKMYADPSACSDCVLKQLNNNETDFCGGLEVQGSFFSPGFKMGLIQSSGVQEPQKFFLKLGLRTTELV